MSLKVTAKETRIGACPYCRDALEPGAYRRCEDCGTRLHADCLRTLGRCPSFGCEAPLRRFDGRDPRGRRGRGHDLIQRGRRRARSPRRIDATLARARSARRRPRVEPVSQRLPAAVLAIFLGAFGAHKFYLGRPLAGLCHLLLGLVWFGALLGVIEGLIYLLRSDEDFIARYQLGSQAWL